MAGSRSDTGEQGFVLIAAIWLLILCGAVAALLLARSLAAAGATAAEAEALQTRLALEAAIETVAADRLINGGRSVFVFAPSEQVMELGGRSVRVRIEAETGKLDLNEGDPRLIERALAGLGWDAPSRTALMQRLRARRDAGARFRSMDEVAAIAGRGRPAGDVSCLDDHFTVHAGNGEPDARFMSAELARLLGRPAPGPDGPRPLPSGAPMRIEASVPDGGSHSAIIRVGGLLDQPIMVSAWERQRRCIG